MYKLRLYNSIGIGPIFVIPSFTGLFNSKIWIANRCSIVWAIVWLELVMLARLAMVKCRIYHSGRDALEHDKLKN